MEQVTVLAEAFGEALTPERLRVYAHDLGDLDLESLRLAFTCARRDLKFFPKIAEIRELVGAGREQEQDAQRRKAWDILMSFVRKYVSNDVHGNYGPEHGWYPKNYPKLSDQILDTVRRTGGWKVYACMTDGDFPFVQRRFFEEHAAWRAVEKVQLSQLIGEELRLQLVAKPMNHSPKVTPALRCPAFNLKKISTPLSDAQLRDRRKLLSQQAELLKTKRP